MQQGKSLALKSLGCFLIESCSKHIQWGIQSQQQVIDKAWLKLPMKTAKWHKQGHSNDFIVKLKKRYTLLFNV